MEQQDYRFDTQMLIEGKELDPEHYEVVGLAVAFLSMVR